MGPRPTWPGRQGLIIKPAGAQRGGAPHAVKPAPSSLAGGLCCLLCHTTCGVRWPVGQASKWHGANVASRLAGLLLLWACPAPLRTDVICPRVSLVWLLSASTPWSPPSAPGPWWPRRLACKDLWAQRGQQCHRPRDDVCAGTGVTSSLSGAVCCCRPGAPRKRGRGSRRLQEAPGGPEGDVSWRSRLCSSSIIRFRRCRSASTPAAQHRLFSAPAPPPPRLPSPSPPCGFLYPDRALPAWIPLFSSRLAS